MNAFQTGGVGDVKEIVGDLAQHELFDLPPPMRWRFVITKQTDLRSVEDHRCRGPENPVGTKQALKGSCLRFKAQFVELILDQRAINQRGDDFFGLEIVIGIRTL